jgi:transposase-like protein
MEMSAKERRIVKRYSAAFKQQVVSEIERGEISVAEARKRYDIGGSLTIDKWLRKLGKLSLLATVVRIEMPHEVDRIKALEQQVRVLEHTLAQTHVKALALEAVVAAVDSHYQIDAKKNFGTSCVRSLASHAKPTTSTIRCCEGKRMTSWHTMNCLVQDSVFAIGCHA